MLCEASKLHKARGLSGVTMAGDMELWKEVRRLKTGKVSWRSCHGGGSLGEAGGGAAPPGIQHPLLQHRQRAGVERDPEEDPVVA